MSLNNLVKRLQDVMRNDAGINGDAQRIEQFMMPKSRNGNYLMMGINLSFQID